MLTTSWQFILRIEFSEDGFAESPLAAKPSWQGLHCHTVKKATGQILGSFQPYDRSSVWSRRDLEVPTGRELFIVSFSRSGEIECLYLSVDLLPT